MLIHPRVGTLDEWVVKRQRAFVLSVQQIRRCDQGRGGAARQPARADDIGDGGETSAVDGELVSAAERGLRMTRSGDAIVIRAAVDRDGDVADYGSISTGPEARDAAIKLAVVQCQLGIARMLAPAGGAHSAVKPTAVDRD